MVVANKKNIASCQFNEGFKGYGVGLDYTVAKNMVATVAYYDTEAKVADRVCQECESKAIWSELTFSF